MLGAFYAIGAAMIFSLGHVAIRKAVGTLGVALGIGVMLVVATLTVAIASFLLEDVSVLTSAARIGFVYFGISGLIHFIGGWGFMNASTRLVGAARMSAITGVTPLFAAMLAMVTLNENLNLFIGLGIVFIVAGTYFIATG